MQEAQVPSHSSTSEAPKEQKYIVTAAPALAERRGSSGWEKERKREVQGRRKEDSSNNPCIHRFISLRDNPLTHPVPWSQLHHRFVYQVWSFFTPLSCTRQEIASTAPKTRNHRGSFHARSSTKSDLVPNKRRISISFEGKVSIYFISIKLQIPHTSDLVFQILSYN